jgi:hypothetical protein
MAENTIRELSTWMPAGRVNASGAMYKIQGATNSMRAIYATSLDDVFTLWMLLARQPAVRIVRRGGKVSVEP